MGVMRNFILAMYRYYGLLFLVECYKPFILCTVCAFIWCEMGFFITRRTYRVRKGIEIVR